MLESLKTNPFVLAPMAGITDHAFRSFMKGMGAGAVVTELVSATGLKYASEKTYDLMSYDETQRPFGIQLFGEDPETLAMAAKIAQDKGADFVDLNFGCPVPKVVKKGGGSAALKDLPQLTKIVSTVKAAITIPLTIKIRTGWDENSKNAVEVSHIAFNEGVAWVAIHGRTRAQGYNGRADWDYIKAVKAQSKLPILGNGDITNPFLAVRRLKESGCDGVLIGRGCLKNPFIFSDALKIMSGSTPDSHERSMWTVYKKLHQQLVAHCDERVLQIQLKKFAAWYSTGYPSASQFRKNIFQAKTVDEVLNLAEDFFVNLNISHQEDTSEEEFLMGGHG